MTGLLRTVDAVHGKTAPNLPPVKKLQDKIDTKITEAVTGRRREDIENTDKNKNNSTSAKMLLGD